MVVPKLLPPSVSGGVLAGINGLWVDDILVETDLDKIDGLEITATHDFRYDIDYFVELDEQVEDVVFIIERTG